MTPLKVIAVVDSDTGLHTAFFKDYPGVVVQGKDKGDVSIRLGVALESFLEHLKGQASNEYIFETSTVDA